MDRLYAGHRSPTGDITVTVDDTPLDPHREVRDHGPGLNWGYGGSGAAQLAIAILTDHLEHHPADLALLFIIAGLPERCDVCGGEAALFDPAAPGDLGRRILARRPGTLLARPEDGDPCWNCQGDDAERAIPRVIDQAHQAFKWRVVSKMPDPWRMSSNDVHVELVELAAIERAKTPPVARDLQSPST